MKLLLFSAVAVMAAGISSATAQTLPGAPETNGVTPKTVTSYVNGTNGVNNLKSESLSIDIANNGNMIVGWEDDGDGLLDMESMWTLLDPNGVLITPQTVVSNRSTLGVSSTLESISNTFLSYYRSDNTQIPGYTGWGPKVKANRFGNGIGMGAMPWEIGLEIPELYDINEDGGGPPPDANDFVCVQLLNNDGTPLRVGAINGTTNLGIVTFTDANVQPAGAIRIGGWDYLSSGNILIVGESRQNDDWVLTGQSTGRTPVYRIVTPGGIEVKEYTAVSSTPDAGNIRNNGAAVTANGFMIRWQGVTGATVRLFDNTGTPTTTNLDLATLTGHPEAGGGGDGNDHGINSNGKDAYVTACDYNNGTNGVWVTVLNADGTVRWSKDVADDMILTGVSGTSAAIDESGQVIVVFAAKIDPTVTGSSVMGRRFNAAGQPAGRTFYVSEAEVPDLSGTLLNSTDPKVAWRNGKIAIAWLTENFPYDSSLAGAPVIAYRLFVSSPLPGAPENNGLTVKTATSYINGTNGVNNLNTEALSVAIAKNGNVIVGWEDDGDGIEDIEAVWTMFDANGNWLTPNTKIDSIAGGISVTNNYLSYFRANGSATPGYVSWGPRLHANPFGDGLGHGSNGDGDLMAGEVTSYAGWLDSGNFPAVQLFDNNGARQSDILAGVSEAYATSDPGSIRIGDWEYLSTGNLVIVGDSRQNDDLVNLYGGSTPANHTIYRIITPAGGVVKPEGLVNDTPVGSSIWYGVGAAKDGFAVRFSDSTRGTCVRMFDNNGNPTTTNLVLATLTGYAQAGGGGRGDSTGFHGNGKDAYVHACDYNVAGFGGFWVTVLNTNGTVRWTRDVSDDMALVAGKVGRGDAAIDENGQVIVVFSSQIAGLTDSITLGRRFDASGNPLGGTFYLSEKEVPNFGTPPAAASNARIAWRNGNVAIVWQSGSYPDALIAPVVAQRYFQTSLAQPIAPSLSVSGNSSSVTISWPASVTGYILESSASLTSGATWTAVPGVANNSVTVVNPTGTQFYRLKQ